jgi:predicted nucleotide-binding protein
MYYQVLIETKEKVGRLKQTNRQLFELDKVNLLEIEEDIIMRYLQNKDLQFDGYFLKSSDILRIVVKQSEKTTKEYSVIENDNMPSGVIMYVSPQDTFSYDKYMTDITKDIFAKMSKKLESMKMDPKSNTTALKPDMTKVFIVHGHDETPKLDVARFIEKLGLKAIILHEQVNSGLTIIEKIEEHSNVGYGIVLYTPCDVGAKKGDESNLQARARQNVVFEHGYLIAKLGRRNVSALVKGKIELPNDISGVVFITMDDHKAWKVEIAKELRSVGYKVDMNLII